MARLFVACTKAAHVPEFNQPSRTTTKVVHEGADVFSDSVHYILPLEYSNKPSESDEGIPPRVRGIAYALGRILYDYRITPACAGNSFAAVPGVDADEDHPRMCGE